MKNGRYNADTLDMAISIAARSTWLRLLIAPLAAFAFLPSIISPSPASGWPACDENLRAALASNTLPECRAYEMVNPPYQEGYPMLMESFAPDGEVAILHSLGNLADNPGSSERIETSSVYFANRTTTGWQLSPMNPPLTQFVGQDMLAAEAKRGDTLWIQHTPQQAAHTRSLYVRSATGNFDFVGPASPLGGAGEGPSDLIDLTPGELDHVRAATDDYSHIVMEAEYPGVGWPSDETVVDERHHSLYEYSGTDNREPTLVGVVGARGSKELIGTCGTTLGSGGQGSSYNALSADGEVIFFTVNPCSPRPATAELYARIHGGVNAVEPAQTVNVSANACTTGCGGEPSGKNFEGASENGTFVYFTSTQKLTNDAIDGTASGEASQGSGCAGTESAMGGCNLYIYDLMAPTNSRLKAVSIGGEVLGVMGTAEDGSRIYYVSRAVINSGGTNADGASPIEGQPNLYVYDATDSNTTFIATLSFESGEDWQRSFERPAQVAGRDGRFLLFASATEALTPDDASPRTQLFEYRAAEGDEPEELARLSKGENGFNQNGNGVSRGVSTSPIAARNAILGLGQDFKSETNPLNISSDGRTVFFLTVGQLSPRATSAAQSCKSLYEFHTDGKLTEGAVHLISDGRDTHMYKGSPCGPLFQGTDASGLNVLFSTADPLLSTDLDDQFDIYDARTDGGFPIPSETAKCSPSTCEGTVPTPIFLSNLSVVGKIAPASAGNQSAKPPRPAQHKKPCKRGVHSRKVKCSSKRSPHNRSMRRSRARNSQAGRNR